MSENLQKAIIIILFQFVLVTSAQSQITRLTIHIRGVHESKISLLPLTGADALKPIAIVESLKDEGTTTIQVLKNFLPGEFVLRFDYKENESSSSYPSEIRIIINNEDLQLWINPIFSNNTDSTHFQEDERENTTYFRFTKENGRQKNMLVLLHNFLMKYDDASSPLYREVITEYEKRRKAYNLWISTQTKFYKELFVSNLFGFQHVPDIYWEGNEAERNQSLRDNYFEGMDFSNPLMLKTTKMKEWMDGYVNLFGELATDVTMRDSLFTIAGRKALERTRNEHAMIHGWMVDYFFNGYESFNIEQGIEMLQPYLNDPNCLTTKRQAINSRLKGIETLIPGATVPNIVLQDTKNIPFDLYSYQTKKSHILLLFWSADCNHCIETVRKLYHWQQSPEMEQKMDVVAIDLDETNYEIRVWQNKIKELKGWTHLIAEDGVRSKVACDYYIIGIPVMVLIDSKSKKILALPERIEQMYDLIRM